MGDHAPGGGEALNAAPDEDDDEDARLIEAGRLLFAREVTFMRGAPALEHLPECTLPEVAFAGRSNVGKSSLINALCGRSGVARTSNTPGRTQELNFFDVDRRLVLVDMPGYGFAQAPKEAVERWTELVKGFLKGRPVLRRAMVLVDSRHGLKDSDRQMMTMLDKAAVVFQVVLTKADKPNAAEVVRAQEGVVLEMKKHPAAHPHVLVTSSAKGTGIAELRAELVQLAESRPAERGS